MLPLFPGQRESLEDLGSVSKVLRYIPDYIRGMFMQMQSRRGMSEKHETQWMGGLNCRHVIAARYRGKSNYQGAVTVKGDGIEMDQDGLRLRAMYCTCKVDRRGVIGGAVVV